MAVPPPPSSAAAISSAQQHQYFYGSLSAYENYKKNGGTKKYGGTIQPKPQEATYGGLTASQWQELADAGFKGGYATGTSSGVGATGGGGTGGGGGGAPAPTGPQSDEEIEDYVRENFPHFAHYLDHPELGKLLKDAAREEWSATKFEGEVSKTEWWKTTADSVRQWDLLKKTDPASYQRLLDARTAEIKNLGHQFGARGIGSYAVIAEQAIKYGWSDLETRNYFANRARKQGMDFESGRIKGGVSTLSDISAYYNEIKTMAKDYHVMLSDNDYEELALRLWTGETSREAIQGFFSTNAEFLYPWLKPQIQSGLSPEQVFQPIKQQVANVLEINPDTINLQDQKWNSLASFVDDNGTRRSMNLGEAQDWARSQDEYRFTKGANEQVYNMIQGLGETFGKVKG